MSATSVSTSLIMNTRGDGTIGKHAILNSNNALASSICSLYTQNLIAGSIGGMFGVIVGHPFDTLRVRLQNSDKGLFKSATDCFMKTVHTEGASGLYKGIIPPLFATTLIKASMFASHMFFLKLQLNPNQLSEPSLINHFISGLGVGVVNSLLSTPIDRAKIILQVQDIKNSIPAKNAIKSKHLNYRHHNYMHRKILFHLTNPLCKHVSPNFFNGTLDVFNKIGLVGMYKGYTATLGREMLGSATYFSTYEILNRLRKNFVDLESQSQTFKFCSSLLTGGLTGTVMWTVMIPIDTIKSKVQAQTLDKKGTMETMKQLYASGGIQAFYRGWRPAVARAIPAHAAVIATYETVIRIFATF